MKMKHAIISLSIFLTTIPQGFAQQRLFQSDDFKRAADIHRTGGIMSDSKNIRTVARWPHGYCEAVAARDNSVYLGDGCVFTILDVSDSAQPVLMGSVELPGFIQDIFIQGNYAYVANYKSGLRIVDIQDPANPREIGYHETSYECLQVHVQGDYAYVTAGGLLVFDITDPAGPMLVFSDRTPNSAQGIFVADGHAYVADEWDGLFIYSLDDPSSPVQVSQLEGMGWAEDIAVSGDYAYAVTRSTGLHIFDVSDPASPREVRNYTINGYGIHVLGDYAYMGAFSSGLHIFAISDPEHAYLESTLDTPGWTTNVFVVNETAFVADSYAGLQIVDVSDTYTPVAVGQYATADVMNAVHVQDDYAYTANGYDGLRIFDISNPEDPEMVSVLETEYPAYDVFVYGDYAYVVHGSWISIISIADPLNPVEASIFITGNQNYDLYITGGYAYTASSQDGFFVYSLTNPTAPELIGELDTPGDAQGVFVKGQYAYVADYNSGLRVISVADPANPFEVASRDVGGRAMKVYVDGEYAYVARSWNGEVRVIRISDPEHPVEVGNCTTPSYAQDIMVSDGLAYVSDWLNGLFVFDVSDPFNPEEAGYFYTAAEHTGRVFVSEGLAFFADGKAGLGIFEYKGPNYAPSAPALMSPPNKTFFKDFPIRLTWQVPQDANNDDLHFKLELARDNGFSSDLRVYESKTDTSNFTPGPPVASGSDSVSYTLVNTLEEGDWFWRVSAWDGEIYGAPSSERSFIIDRTPPYTFGHDPAPGATGVAMNTDIVVHLTDDWSGMDLNTIVMALYGYPVDPVISGSPTDYTVTYDPPADFELGDTVTVSIRAADRLGIQMSVETYSFIISQFKDVEPPVINHTPVSTATLGQTLTVSAHITDNHKLNSATFHYRQGGGDLYASVPMTDLGNGTFQATVPASSVTERGVEYYLITTDSVGYSTFDPTPDPGNSPHVVQVVWSSLNCSFSTIGSGYRMISSPGILDNGTPGGILEDDLGTLDRTEWRLFLLQGGSFYTEYGTGSFGNFAPGSGFWLITKNTKIWNVGSGRSVTTAADFTISLVPGWNLIGNPFAYDINWSDFDYLYSVNIEGLWNYSGTGNEASGYIPNQRQLRSWKGYLVKNNESSPVTITIPAYTVSIQPMSKMDDPPWVLKDKDWVVRIKAECGRFTDWYNYLGCLSDADDRWDRHDFSEPPPIGEFISLYFPHDDWMQYPGKYAGDFRKAGSEGHTWDFEVRTNVKDSDVRLSFEDMDALPKGIGLKLLDMDLRVSKDLDFEPAYSLTSSTEETVRHFRIVAGSDAYVENNDQGFDTGPEVFQLLQNTPNPFNASTRIQYHLPEASRVDIRIVTGSGKAVRRLLENRNQPAGYRTVQWDGRDDMGLYVSSGIYICTIRAGKYKRSIKMLMVR